MFQALVLCQIFSDGYSILLLPGPKPLTPMSDQERIFFLQHQYNINQISDENKDRYQFGDN